ncbi:phage tail tape measure protein [Vibrio parahaemolyticus]|nr:phage tail tape measure protein [Vibrio parahaemolyticus]
MRKKLTLNEYIHILLIDKNLNGVSVTSLRDELLKLTHNYGNAPKARKFVYRQLLRLEKQGLLSTTGTGRDKTYHKTDRFHELQLVLEPENNVPTKTFQRRVLEDSVLDELMLEKARCSAELEFAVAGIDEYRSLAKKLPIFESELLAKSEFARERSVQYTVKLEALIYAIELNQNGAAKC